MTVLKVEVKNMIWDPAETLPREELRTLQLSRLRESLTRAQNVPFYKKHLAGLNPQDIKSIEDLRKLPFTTKADLRGNYPLGMLAVPRGELSRIHGSSGTTGKPTFVGYTENDIKMWANLCARFLTAGGLRRHHMAHIAFGLGLFTGGFGLHFGISAVGACIVPASAGNTRRQVMLIQDLAADALICTPSYALNIAEVAREEGLDPRSLPLQFGFFGGEMWTEDMRARIESELGILATNNYGLSEVIGPGVSGECQFKTGMHIQEDHFIVECIDPETLQPVAPGEQGELVFTSLTKEAMPIIRYRTRDIARLDASPCPCGRTSVRMGRVLGRSDDMLIIRGVNVFPSQIEEALFRVEGTAPHYQIIVDRPHNLDEVTVKVELRPEAFSDKMTEMQNLRDRINHEIHTIAQIGVKVELVPPQTLDRFDGKAVRVVDHRKPIVG